MSSPRMPQPGDRIAGKYQLQRVVGHGGFATVFEAVDVTLDREVAIKVLKPGEDGYEVTLAQRFKREAKLVSRLNDPHTIQMFDFGRTDDGLLFMVFELLGGEDISTRLSREGAMRPRDVELVLRQVLAALREAHSLGLLHRDIKPANVRVFRYMNNPLRAKLMDFGIARLAGADGRLTKTGAIVGTPRYMAPEQFTGEELTPASDLFSLGLVVYEMLTGEPAPRQDIILGKRVDIPVGGRLGELLDEMLRVEAARRVQSVEEALAILDGESELAETTKMPTHPGLPELEGPTNELDQHKTDRNYALPIGLGLLACAAILVLVARVLTVEDVEPPSAVVTPPPPVVKKQPLPPKPAVESEPSADLGIDQGVPSGCGATDYPGADGDRRVEREAMVGFERNEYTVLLPKRYDPRKAYGLIIAFHDVGVTRGHLEDGAKLREATDEHDVIAVLPRGDGLIPWVAIDARALAQHIVDDMTRSYCIEADRVYVLGEGKGGIAAEQLSCEPWLTASATMAFRKWRQKFACSPAGPAPYLHLAPTKSGHLPLEGGHDCLWESETISLKDHNARWRERNLCQGEAQTEKHGKTTCYTWDCAAPFEACHLDGGMPWPGMSAREIDVLRCDGHATKFPVHDHMWAFFDRATQWKREP